MNTLPAMTNVPDGKEIMATAARDHIVKTAAGFVKLQAESNAKIVAGNPAMAEKAAEADAKIEAAFAKLTAITDAGWWIANRAKDAKYLLIDLGR